MAARRIEWVGVDDPRRRDTALVRFTSGGLLGAGASVADGWTSAWSLDAAHGFVTRRLQVRTQGPGWWRSLELRRDEDGRWSADTASEGSLDDEPPGLPDLEALDGAVDCDLGLNPLTNTLPIRRLGLLERPAAETVLIMALIEVPSLRVERSPQRYGSAAAGLQLGHEIDFASEAHDFQARLPVDPAGVVLDYPHLARRVP